MPFEEVNADSVPEWSSSGVRSSVDAFPVVMLEAPTPVDPEPSLRTLWLRLPMRRVLVPAVLAALVLGAAVGALTTYALDQGAATPARAAIQVRIDEDALAQGLDVYGLTRPALPLLITNSERTIVRVAELAWDSPRGRLVWYGDASAVDPGREARIWGESEISCVRDAGRALGLSAYVLLPTGGGRTVQLDDPRSVAVLQETLRRACG